MYVFLSIKKLVLFKNVFLTNVLCHTKENSYSKERKLAKPKSKTKQKNKCLR